MKQKLIAWCLRFKALLLAGIAVAVLVAGTLAVKWPFREDELIRTLESRSSRKVTVGSFRKTYFPPGLEATDVQFLRHNHPNHEALIKIEKLALHTSWARMITFQHRLPRVDVYGMRLMVPPRGKGEDGQHHELIPLNSPNHGGGMEVDAIAFHGANVKFLPGESGTEPFQIVIRELLLTRVRNNQPFGFEGTVENPLPRGQVHQKGSFGPWNSEEPSRTPIKGTYEFKNARLSDIPGISGTMQTQGTFEGTLDKIQVDGKAQIPDFQVLRSLHTESLTTTYQAAVDATNGNVELQHIDTKFGHTLVRATGTVSGRPNRKGRFANLQARVDGGRMEELEAMFMKSKIMPISGGISLETSITLPPGPEPFLKRLGMKGHFLSSGDKFSSAATQDKVNILAGHEPVRSRITANVMVASGTAHVSNLMMYAPQTEVRLDGTLDLISKEVDMQGTLRTDGKLSDTETGFKSFAIKLVSPFLKKKGATVVAFGLAGPFGDVHPRMELGAKRKL